MKGCVIMGKFSRADEDWVGCDSGCDYFFANIYNKSEEIKKSPEQLKAEAIRDYLNKLDNDRRERFPMRYNKSAWEYEKKLKVKECARFLRHLDSLLPEKRHTVLMKEFYPDKRDKFSTELYNQGFSILDGVGYFESDPDILFKNLIIEVGNDIEYIIFDISYRNHPNHRVCVPIETYRVVKRKLNWITRKKYEVVGYEKYPVRIFRLSTLKPILSKCDEYPTISIYKVGRK